MMKTVDIEASEISGIFAINWNKLNKQKLFYYVFLLSYSFSVHLRTMKFSEDVKYDIEKKTVNRNTIYFIFFQF
jgi:hypothetical protein